VKDILVPALCAGMALCCAPSEATSKAHSAGQTWAAMRRAGWCQTIFTVARVAVVLLIVTALWCLIGCWAMVVRGDIEVLAVHAEIPGLLVTRPEVRA